MFRYERVAGGLLILMAAASLLAQGAGQSVRGDVVDHVLLLLPGEAPARFVGPDLRVRELRYTVGEASGKAPRVKGSLTFSRKSSLREKLSELLKREIPFEMVVYYLDAEELVRLRFEGVKVVGGEKNGWRWTAASVETTR
ncbi:MAG: hypothetical protein HY653_02545 [Acidobacteria bacterium]|nr:hypothetical protein [Acidobacteriota bacterium]